MDSPRLVLVPDRLNVLPHPVCISLSGDDLVVRVLIPGNQVGDPINRGIEGIGAVSGGVATAEETCYITRRTESERSGDMKKFLGSWFGSISVVFRVPAMKSTPIQREARQSGLVGFLAAAAWRVPLEQCDEESRAMVVRLRQLTTRYQLHLRQGENFGTVLFPEYKEIRLLGQQLFEIAKPEKVGTYVTLFGG